MASFFKQLSDDMERVAQVVEEGTKFMWGEVDHMGGDPTEATSGAGGDGGDDFHIHDSGDEDGAFDDMEGMEDAAYGSPLMGMADSVMSDIMSTQIGPQTSLEHVQAFTAAITWKEPFIQSLIAFHILILIATIFINKKGGIYARMGLMLTVGLIVRLAEYLNDMGNAHWREFATQNYFDKSGIFMGIMVCTPLLFVCLFTLVAMIREANHLLVDVKTMKMKAQMNSKQKQNKQQQQQQQRREQKTKGKKKGIKKD